MKQLINKTLAVFGYRIRKIVDESLPAKSADNAIKRISGIHHINTVVDIGASSGIWSQMAMNHYSEAKYLLIEAQPVHEEALSAFTRKNQNTQFVLAAAGETLGQIFFDAGDPFSGQASYTPYEKDNIIVPVITVDSEVGRRGLKGPYLLKLDTHGFEVPIFKGAMQTLQETEIIVVECYNFQISPECLLFYEMCEYLNNLGFRCVDLVDPLWRPYDQAFWQMDLVFVRTNSPEFTYSNYA